MQISCEKCSTSYNLDDRLLPPGGAPVQCTQCSHVFIARPSADAVASPPDIAKPRPASAPANGPEVLPHPSAAERRPAGVSSSMAGTPAVARNAPGPSSAVAVPAPAPGTRGGFVLDGEKDPDFMEVQFRMLAAEMGAVITETEP